MTAIKLDSSLSQAVLEILEPHADRLFAHLGEHMVAVVDIKAAERNQAAEDEEKNPWIKLRITSIELATGAHEEQVRNVQQALYRVRTKDGTLDELLAAEQTIEHAAGVTLTTVPFNDGEE